MYQHIRATHALIYSWFYLFFKYVISHQINHEKLLMRTTHLLFIGIKFNCGIYSFRCTLPWFGISTINSSSTHWRESGRSGNIMIVGKFRWSIAYYSPWQFNRQGLFASCYKTHLLIYVRNRVHQNPLIILWWSYFIAIRDQKKSITHAP